MEAVRRQGKVRDDARGVFRAVPCRIAVFRSDAPARAACGQGSDSVEEVQSALLQGRRMLPGRALFSDPFVNVGSEWLQPLHANTGQLDRNHQWPSVYLSAGGGVAGAYLSAPGVKLLGILPVCPEVLAGMLETLDGYGR